MSRINVMVLEVGLLISSLAAILFALRIILQQVIGGSWFWGGAMAAFAAPVAFALALYLYDRRLPAVRKEAAE